ncbi:hypothetical protein WDU94_002821 [Cyamophila willieti]
MSIKAFVSHLGVRVAIHWLFNAEWCKRIAGAFTAYQFLRFNIAIGQAMWDAAASVRTSHVYSRKCVEKTLINVRCVFAAKKSTCNKKDLEPLVEKGDNVA